MALEIEGLKPFLARINQLPKTAQNEIREAAMFIADDEIGRIAQAGRTSDRQSAAVATFIKARRDRVPAIAAGGNTKTGVKGGATSGQLFFGAEFGGGSTKRFERQETKTEYTTASGKTRTKTKFGKATFAGTKHTTNQFRPWLGKTGYWFWPTLRADSDRMMQRWEGVVEAIAREWTRGGDV